jgi:AraC family transcriptional regulator
MEKLNTGEFFGNTENKLSLPGITLTRTVYNKHKYVPWHYHECAYFLMLLSGRLIEVNKKEVKQCVPGTVLFHNWQDAHYNEKPEGFASGFHIEIDLSWFSKLMPANKITSGSFEVLNPTTRIQLYRLLKELKNQDNLSELAIESALLKVLMSLGSQEIPTYKNKPAWVERIRQILNDDLSNPFSLSILSDELGIHPIHISRDFSRYFECNLGEYVRKLRVLKAFALMGQEKLSLGEIAFKCGFADHSQMVRCCKDYTAFSPAKFRRFIMV